MTLADFLGRHQTPRLVDSQRKRQIHVSGLSWKRRQHHRPHTDLRIPSDVPGNVLALEYRGYGLSEGKPSEAGIYRDADAGYQYLINEKHIDPRSIIAFGQSLGTAVAAHLAAQHQVGAVVLEAPFPSASRLARIIFRFLPGLSLLVRGQFDTQARVQEIHAPILIVHCLQDPVLPFKLGKEVYAASNPPKTFLEINSRCHEESSIIAPDKYRAALQNFLNGVGR